MNWRVIIRPNAEADLREAWLWYESQRPGLGDELLKEVRSRFADWKATRKTGHFVVAIFAACCPAGFLTNFFIAWNVTASLSSAFYTRNGNTGGSFEWNGRAGKGHFSPRGFAIRQEGILAAAVEKAVVPEWLRPNCHSFILSG